MIAYTCSYILFQLADNVVMAAEEIDHGPSTEHMPVPTEDDGFYGGNVVYARETADAVTRRDVPRDAARQLSGERVPSPTPSKGAFREEML